MKGKIRASSWIPDPLIDEQIEWFYNTLGIDDVYFQLESVDAIASNITSLYAAKIAAFAREDKKQEIRLDMEASDHAIYIDTTEPGVSSVSGPRYEHRLETKYLDSSSTSRVFRVETFRSPGNLSGATSSKATLRCYFVYQCLFVDPNPSPLETRLEVIGDRMFLAKATKNTKQIYQEIISLAVARTGPVIEVFDIEDSKEKRLVVAFRRRTAMGMFSALSDLYHYYGVTSSRKYVEQFSNGICVICLYFKPAPSSELGGRFPPLEQSIHQITKEISLLYCIPQNKFQDLFASGRLSLQEAVYGHCLYVFVQHFLNRLGTCQGPRSLDVVAANTLQVPSMRLWFPPWTRTTARTPRSSQRSSVACVRRPLQLTTYSRSSARTRSSSGSCTRPLPAPTLPTGRVMRTRISRQPHPPRS